MPRLETLESRCEEPDPCTSRATWQVTGDDGKPIGKYCRKHATGALLREQDKPTRISRGAEQAAR